MPLIEGLGDEVTIILGGVGILLIGLLAWFSTHTTDIPFFSVIIVELSQRASRNSANTNPDGQSLPADNGREREQQIAANVSDGLIGQSDSLDEVMNSAIDDMNAALGLDRHLDEDEEEEEDDDEEEEIAEQDSVEIQTPSSQTVTESQTSSEENIRRRRLAFFDNSHPSDRAIQSSPDTQTREVEHSVDRQPRSRLLDQAGSGSAHQSETIPPAPSPLEERRDITDSNESDDLQIRVRLKYLNDTQRLVFARPMDTIGVFRRTHFSEELSQHKLVRLIYNGQDLRNETSTLQSCNIVDNSVLHCLVTQNVSSEQRRSLNADEEFNLGDFMLPIFGVLLGILWYLRFNYKQYFNAISTLSLAGISFLFVFAAFTSWRTNRVGVQDDRHLE